MIYQNIKQNIAPYLCL